MTASAVPLASGAPADRRLPTNPFKVLVVQAEALAKTLVVLLAGPRAHTMRT